MASIRHSSGTLSSARGTPLPDFRNQGLVLRLVLAVNGLALLAVLLQEPDWSVLPEGLPLAAARVEPPLFFCLLMLYGLQPGLARLPGAVSLLLVAAIGGFAALVSTQLLAAFGVEFSWRPVLWGMLMAGALAHYFSLRQQALSPALAEARLLALTARIRPHFLFNSLNAVLGIMRADPRRAETALEELSDLFRALMAENRDLVPLSQEIALARQYLDLEHLRLGERLSVRWEMESCPPDARVPPLLLQPLVENAVHHGIEPSVEPGEIKVTISGNPDGILIRIANPWHGEDAHTQGNRLALGNVRERLMLFYDLEARLETSVHEGLYLLEMRLPCRRESES